MVQRILLDATGIKISRPSVNVLTASVDQLMMMISARHAQVLFSGLIVGGGGTVNFGSPLPSRPDALVAPLLDIGGSSLINSRIYYGSLLDFTNSSFMPGYVLPNNYIQVVFGTSSLTLTSYRVDCVGIRYIVFRKPLAA